MNWIQRNRWRGNHPQKSRASHPAQRGESFKADSGGEDAGSGFFQKCLAKSRGSTPAEQQVWREGVHDQIRQVMPLQGGLTIERMCQLAQVGRAGFYRRLQEPEPESDMGVRSAIQPDRAGT
jgi:hypothetical protein